MLGLYRAAAWAGGPLIRLYLVHRRRRGKEDAARFSERLGIAGRERPAGPLVWVHAASIGESLSMLPLIRCLGERYPWLSVLVTTGTVTSAGLMAERLPRGSLHQYVPVDRRAYVRRFLDHWRPDLVLWAESEFWPNLLSEAAARAIPAALVNGRVSPRSFAGWRRAPGLIGRLLSGFTVCLGQTEADAERLVRLGAPGALCLGNLKVAAPPLPADADALAALEGVMAARPRWLAASTHAGEEDVAGRVHRLLKPHHPGLLTVIVPRHPARGGDIARALAASGLRVAQRSAAQPVTQATDVLLADTLGELGLFYRLADIVFMGKSLAARGGQNPLEAARLECALIFGPHMDNFADIASSLAAAGAAEEVGDDKSLAGAVGRLLGDAGERHRRAACARRAAEAEAGVLDAVMAELAPLIAPLTPGDSSRAGP